MGKALVQMCAWGLSAIYIYTSGDPCIYMHVVILILMLQQSQVLWPQRLNFFCWRRCIKAKYTVALGPDEAESRRKKRWQLHALLVPQECQKRPKTRLLKPLAAKWDTSTSWQLIWTEKARHVAPQVSPRGCQKKTNFEDFLVLFLDHIRNVLLEAFRHEMGPRMRPKMGHFRRWLTLLKCSK